MSINTVPHSPYSPDLAPYDFWLFSKLRGCRYETIEEMKEAVTKVIDKAHTRGLPWSLPDVVRTVQKVHCSRRRLLRRVLEFHVCTINKSAHTKKVWKLYLMILVYIYIYIYIYTWRNKEVHTFPKDISPKMNVIERLEFELSYYDAAVHHVSHYTTGSRSKP